MACRSATLSLLVLLAALAGACGAHDDLLSGSSPTPPSTTPTTVVERVTTGTATTTSQEATPGAYAKTEDVRYMADQDGLHPPLMDIYAPDGSGPSPVVVLYHPDPTYNTKRDMDRLAKALAEGGMVVFNTTWGGSGRSGESEGWEAVFMGEGPCSYWFAHQEAETYGGDPSDISLVGFSGGGNMAVAVAMYGGSLDLGCHAQPMLVEPSRVVAFEGDFLMAPWWDEAITTDPSFYADWAVWEHIDAYEGAPIDILADRKTAEAASYTVTGLGSTVEDFLSLRDDEGSITADLTTIGALADDNLDLTEFNTLFHYRLEQAQKPTSLTWIDEGAHTMSWTAVDAITELLKGSSSP